MRSGRNPGAGSDVCTGVRPLTEIRKELDEASERRAALWEELSHGVDPPKSGSEDPGYIDETSRMRTVDEVAVT